jgi:hypothetical protein
MRLKYVGPWDAVEVPELGRTVEQGEIVEVDEAIGKRMAESDLWQVTSRSTKKED